MVGTWHSNSTGRRQRERIKDMFRAIDACDWQALACFFHPDMVYERPGYAPLVGREQVLHFYRHERMIVSGVHQVDGVAVDKNAAASWGRLRATLKDGSIAEVQFADVYTFTDDRIRVRRSYFFRPAV